jgi:hypothetical protein
MVLLALVSVLASFVRIFEVGLSNVKNWILWNFCVFEIVDTVVRVSDLVVLGVYWAVPFRWWGLCHVAWWPLSWDFLIAIRVPAFGGEVLRVRCNSWELRLWCVFLATPALIYVSTSSAVSDMPERGQTTSPSSLCLVDSIDDLFKCYTRGSECHFPLALCNPLEEVAMKFYPPERSVHVLLACVCSFEVLLGFGLGNSSCLSWGVFASRRDCLLCSLFISFVLCFLCRCSGWSCLGRAKVRFTLRGWRP